MKLISKVFFTITTSIILACSSKTPLEVALESDSEAIKKIMEDPENYELQIMYTQIDRDQNNVPSFRNFEFNVNDSIYFYPASTVKFPIALIALEKLEELRESGIKLNRKTNFKTQQDTLYTNIEQEIIKIFAVSSNQAYNRLFEFLGQDYINQKLKSKKIKARITHRLSTDDADNRTTQSTTFKEDIHDSTTIYQQESIKNSIQPNFSLRKVSKGKGYIDNDTLIQHPKDFSKKNYLPLRSLHEMMKRIQFPEMYTKNQRFTISANDYEFVLNAMSTLPYQAGYDKNEFYDSYGKFFIFGDSKNDIPEHIKIFNKVGYAYGYLTDCSYIHDTKNNIEFILTATVHVNKNGIFNDDHYEYDDIGIPFLAQLGSALYTIEKEK